MSSLYFYLLGVRPPQKRRVVLKRPPRTPLLLLRLANRLLGGLPRALPAPLVTLPYAFQLLANLRIK